MSFVSVGTPERRSAVSADFRCRNAEALDGYQGAIVAPADWSLAAYLCVGYPEEEQVEPPNCNVMAGRDRSPRARRDQALGPVRFEIRGRLSVSDGLRPFLVRHRMKKGW